LNVRTYTAATLADALAEVKQGLGRHAVVLHTRTYKRGGVLGLGARSVVEVTAADGRELGRQRGREAAQSPRAQKLREARQRAAALPAPSVPSAATAEPALAGDLIRRTYQAAKTQLDPPAAPPSLEPVITAPPPTLVPDQQVTRELQAVRQLVEQVARHQQTHQTLTTTPPRDALPDPLVEHYAALIENEIAAELADEVVRSIDVSDPADVAEALQAKLAEQLPIDDAAGRFVATDDGRPRTIALVGPTGVGKTTTLAKLAATFKLKQNKKVGLITADTYRIAAVEQLRTYAQIIGLPLEIVSGADELEAALGRLSDMDVVLIDTAGRSQRNADRLDELSTLLGVARPHETHLVLSATASQKVLRQIAERFDTVNPDRIIFTKLDEAAACGALLNVARDIGKPLSYLTTGQEVPHQIEPADAGRLAALIMGREAVAS
jgi:flagellar biosynthesis protein FlhF